VVTVNIRGSLPFDDMALIPAGEFVMGARDDERIPNPYGSDDPEQEALWWSRPQRRIYLDAYVIDRYPVTNSQYQRFVRYADYPVPKDRHPVPLLERYSWDSETRSFPAGMDDYPVVLVSWYEALAYCEWRALTLPTEAQWEKAARGTDGQPYPWGYSQDFKNRCRCYGAGEPRLDDPLSDLAPVTAYPDGQSPYGCFDMLGNAAEWCLDPFHEYSYHLTESLNPFPARPGTRRAMRGDRYVTTPHAAIRNCGMPWDRHRSSGFRCAAWMRDISESLMDTTNRRLVD
jgi:formylglycine-generating enzyme